MSWMLTTSGAISALMPRMNKTLKMLLPTTLPMAMSVFPSSTAWQFVHQALGRRALSVVDDELQHTGRRQRQADLPTETDAVPGGPIAQRAAVAHLRIERFPFAQQIGHGFGGDIAELVRLQGGRLLERGQAPVQIRVTNGDLSHILCIKKYATDELTAITIFLSTPISLSGSNEWAHFCRITIPTRRLPIFQKTFALRPQKLINVTSRAISPRDICGTGLCNTCLY